MAWNVLGAGNIGRRQTTKSSLPVLNETTLWNACTRFHFLSLSFLNHTYSQPFFILFFIFFKPHTSWSSQLCFSWAHCPIWTAKTYWKKVGHRISEQHKSCSQCRGISDSTLEFKPEGEFTNCGGEKVKNFVPEEEISGGGGGEGSDPTHTHILKTEIAWVCCRSPYLDSSWWILGEPLLQRILTDYSGKKRAQTHTVNSEGVVLVWSHWGNLFSI